MAGMLTLTEFAALTTGMVVKLDQVKRECLDNGAKVIQEESKRVLGTYDYGWPQLSTVTQDDREARGYTRNEPGLREGDMKDSIERTVISASEAQVGSNDDKMVYFDIGTPNQPPRPVFQPAAIAKEKEIARELGHSAVDVLTGKAHNTKLIAP